VPLLNFINKTVVLNVDRYCKVSYYYYFPANLVLE